MGLDVYLYRYENKLETDRKEELYEQESERNWELAGDYKTLSDGHKDMVRDKNKAFAISLGLEESGEDPHKERIEFDSKTDKDHYFKVGYLRSSYNGAGIDAVLRNLGLPTLSDIFGYENEYCFQPDWAEALKMCESVIDQLQSKGNYRCFHVSENMFGGKGLPQNEKEAMDIFMAEINRSDKSSFDAYSNGKGEFWLKEPMKVHAIIPGEYSIFRPMKCCYVIMEGGNEWYINALQITKETIEYVLARPDKEKYWLHWSS